MRLLLLFLILTVLSSVTKAQSVIRINQLGYLPKSIKVAVFLSNQDHDFKTFSVHNAQNNEFVLEGNTKSTEGSNWGMKSAFRLDFSKLETVGEYYIKAGNAQSPVFRIDSDVYDGTADFILNYIRQQRCGYNPYLKDSCHTHDGVIVDHPTRSGEKIDVVGGWHDATDYLQYSTFA